MKLQNKKKLATIFVLMLTVFCFPKIVAANERVKNVIIPNTNATKRVCVDNLIYSITNAGSKVQLSKLGKDDLLFNSTGGCYLQNGKCPQKNKKNDKDYTFKVEATTEPCAITNGKIGDDKYTYSGCPLTTNVSATVIQRSIESKWVNNVWVFTVTDDAKNLYELRESKCLQEKNGQCINYDYIGGKTLAKNALGQYTFTVAPGENYTIGVASKANDACDGVLLGQLQGAASTYVDNPYINTASCKNFVANVPTDNTSMAGNMLSVCYNKKISYSKIKDYAGNKLDEAIANAKQTIRTFDKGIVENINTLQCSFDQSKNTTNISSSTPGSNEEYTNILDSTKENKYWIAVCTEKLTISYEQPKGVSAGQGFSYSPVVKMERSCKPIQLKKVEKKDNCIYSVECWGGPANHIGEPVAGPNENFDECVQKCDGGKYSQDCINKCYQETYGASNSNTKSNGATRINYNTPTLVSNTNKQPSELGQKCDGNLIVGDSKNVQRNPNGEKNYNETNLPLSSCQVTTNAESCTNSWCKSEHGISFPYAEICSSNEDPTRCYEVFVSDPNCAKDQSAEEEYKNELQKSRKELEEVIGTINKYTSESTKDETFSAKIIDSYTGKTQEYKNNTSAKVQVKVVKAVDQTEDYISIATDPIDIELGTHEIKDTNGNIISTAKVSSYNVERTIQLSLDYGYVSKTTVFDTIYGSAYNASNKNNYYAGEQKYFTHINSKGINLYEKWPTILGTGHKDAIDENNKSLTQNIKYEFDKLGSWNQWTNVNLDCFYGIKKAPDTGTGTPVPASGGLDFIYRPIDLNSPFPDRTPRWNWSTKAVNNKYNINPTKTLEEITAKGYGIYESSNQKNEIANNNLDYEIVLTKQNISRIREYNREKGGEYLNYDMYCYEKDGANVCRSELLGGIHSSNNNYMTILKRGNIGCNNQTSSDQCERGYTNVGGSK